MASVELSRAEPRRFARELFDGLAARYDWMAEVLSFGQNRRWRTRMVTQAVAADPATVLDVASGTAGVALALAARSRARITALDLTEQMIRLGRRRVHRAGMADRVDVLIGDGATLPFPDASFDAVTFTYLLRYVADPAATVRELARVLRPGGTLASLEFAVPSHPLWRLAWRGYTRAILPAAGLLLGGREWAAVGRFLGPSIEAHYRQYPVSSTVQAWEAAGIADVAAHPMSLGGGIIMWGRKND